MVEKCELGTVVQEGSRLIERWAAAKSDLVGAENRLNTAKSELTNSIVALGKWLCPKDVQKGEKICVWYGDSLIQCEYTGGTIIEYAITVRQRGKSLV